MSIFEKDFRHMGPGREWHIGRGGGGGGGGGNSIFKL